MYKIEEQCRDAGLSHDQTGEKRQQEAIPVLNRFYNWLQEELPKGIARTPIHKAILYTLTRFKELRAYTTDGMLQIDNNLMEQQLRDIVVGRKNFLFAGSHCCGERAAIIYSLLGTCKLQGIDPSKSLMIKCLPASLDCLLYHCEIINFAGKSYRMGIRKTIFETEKTTSISL